MYITSRRQLPDLDEYIFNYLATIYKGRYMLEKIKLIPELEEKGYPIKYLLTKHPKNYYSFGNDGHLWFLDEFGNELPIEFDYKIIESREDVEFLIKKPDQS